MRYFIPVLFFILSIAACQSSTTDTTTSQTEITTDTIPEEAVIAKGKEVAGATFAVLSATLQKAIQEEGIAGALEFCNLRALPITDSLSDVHQATIRRTALRFRNPANAPDQAEQAILQQYQSQLENGETLKPVVAEINPSEVAFYAPILANDLCLKCHGIPGETLLEEDLITIRQIYPEDQAIGFAAGDLRGIWSIRFDRSGF